MLRKHDPGRFQQVLAIAALAYGLGRVHSLNGRWAHRPDGPGTSPKRKRPIDMVLVAVQKLADKQGFTVPINLGAQWRSQERRLLVAAYDLGLSDANEDKE